MKERTHARLAISIALLIALIPRLCVLWEPAADLYGLDRGEIGEEIVIHAIGAELVEGSRLPLLDMQYTTFHGGSLWMSVCGALGMVVWGPSLRAFKLVPVIWHLLALFLAWRILRRWLAPWPCFFVCLPFAAGTPSYAILTTIAWGTHAQSVTLTLACIAACLAVQGRGLWARAAYGVLLGLALHFGYAALLVIAALGAAELWVKPRPSLRTSLATGAGLAVGMIPWLAYNLSGGFAGLSLYGRPIQSHAVGADPSARLMELWTQRLPEALSLVGPRGEPSLFLGVIASLGVLLLAVSPWIARRERSPESLALPADERALRLLACAVCVYLSLFLLSQLLSSFPTGGSVADPLDDRYFTLALPWIVLGLGVLWVRPLPQSVALGGAIGSGLMALMFTTSFLRQGYDPSAEEPASWSSGPDSEALAQWVLLRYCDDPGRIEHFLVATKRRSGGQAVREIMAIWGPRIMYVTERKEATTERDKRFQASFLSLREQLPDLIASLEDVEESNFLPGDASRGNQGPPKKTRPDRQGERKRLPR